MTASKSAPRMRAWGWVGFALIALCLLGAVVMSPNEGVLLLLLTSPAWITLLLTAFLVKKKPA
ncbi:hypothetical protein [Demequina sediminicola]|uniref:hypothetical protein n=1 Tax=Demequina sediminicola TaxID=1095026 RepID=UPI000783BF44|nr:hypothetical protein [Demequina sediminicola]